MQRLQKLLSACGAAQSRRHAEDLLRGGRIAIDGRIATLGESMLPTDLHRLTLDGRTLHVEAPRDFLHFALHKPRHYLSAWSDSREQRTLGELMEQNADVIPAKILPRLVHAGRLDKDSEGLLLLTEDGISRVQAIRCLVLFPKGGPKPLRGFAEKVFAGRRGFSPVPR
jgi:23S rRNA pseudouridine2605 synthase